MNSIYGKIRCRNRIESIKALNNMDVRFLTSNPRSLQRDFIAPHVVSVPAMENMMLRDDSYPMTWISGVNLADPPVGVGGSLKEMRVAKPFPEVLFRTVPQ